MCELQLKLRGVRRGGDDLTHLFQGRRVFPTRIGVVGEGEEPVAVARDREYPKGDTGYQEEISVSRRVGVPPCRHRVCLENLQVLAPPSLEGDAEALADHAARALAPNDPGT